MNKVCRNRKPEGKCQKDCHTKTGHDHGAVTRVCWEDMKKSGTTESDLRVWVRCPSLHLSCSSSRRSSHPLRLGALAVYWNTFSIYAQDKWYVSPKAVFKREHFFKFTSCLNLPLFNSHYCTVWWTPQSEEWWLKEKCHLKEVELVVVKDPVVVQVRYFEYSS